MTTKTVCAPMRIPPRPGPSGEHIPDGTLKLLRFVGLCLFYGVSWLRRPGRPFRILWNVYTGRQESRSEMGLANLIRRRRLTVSGPETAS